MKTMLAPNAVTVTERAALPEFAVALHCIRGGDAPACVTDHVSQACVAPAAVMVHDPGPTKSIVPDAAGAAADTCVVGGWNAQVWRTGMSTPPTVTEVVRSPDAAATAIPTDPLPMPLAADTVAHGAPLLAVHAQSLAGDVMARLPEPPEGPNSSPPPASTERLHGTPAWLTRSACPATIMVPDRGCALEFAVANRARAPGSPGGIVAVLLPMTIHPG